MGAWIEETFFVCINGAFVNILVSLPRGLRASYKWEMNEYMG